MEQVLDGGCQCGQVRYRLTGAPRRTGLCHCADCRRSAGAPVVAWALFARAQLERSGEVATYASSEHGRRQFWPRCGTGLFYLNDDIFAGLVDVRIATLDDPDAVTPIEQIQTAERIGWMAGAHGLPAFARWLD